MNETVLFAITLYVPDATVRALNEVRGLRALILDGTPDLDFIAPAWWEGSHTARLGLIQVDRVAAQESSGDTGGEDTPT